MQTRTTLTAAALITAGALLGWLAGSGGLTETFAQDKKPAEATPEPPADFKGVIKLDIRDSKPDWTPFTPKAAAEAVATRVAKGDSSMEPAPPPRVQPSSPSSTPGLTEAVQRADVVAVGRRMVALHNGVDRHKTNALGMAGYGKRIALILH